MLIIKKASSVISYIFIYIAFLASSRCWIGFENRGVIFNYILPFILLFLYAIRKYRIKGNPRNGIFSFLLYIALLYISIRAKGEITISSMINQSFLPLSYYLIISLVDAEKERLLNFFIKWTAIILLIGLLIYLCSFFVNFPSFGIIKTHYGGDVYGTPCYNYLFFLKQIEVGATGMLRFNGPFIEPGDLGCTLSFLLLAAQYDFKKYRYLKFLLIPLFFSFSLAGYCLTAFGYATNMCLKNKLSIKKLVFGIITLITVISFGTFYNGGDNYLNKSILSRLQDDNMQVGNVNGRTSMQKMEYFYFMLADPELLFLGYDKITMERLNETGLGAGIINQIVALGLISVLLFFSPFFYYSARSKCKKYSFFLFIFLALYAYQRFDLNILVVIMCYTFGIVIEELRIKKT